MRVRVRGVRAKDTYHLLVVAPVLVLVSERRVHD